MISIICPFYNEEKTIPFFFESIEQTMKGEEYEIICVDDGSSDSTFSVLDSFASSDSRVVVVRLSRNFGKEAALTAGLDFSKGDAVVPIDSDLQDPPELILRMIEKWREGFDVVLAERIDRSEDSFLKRTTALLFYRTHNSISNPKIPENVGDFRLMSRKVVEAIKKMPERQRFMKGIFAWVGFKTCFIQYKRKKRITGESKFNCSKLWNLAVEGITSFSSFPLTIWLRTGFFIALCSFLYGVFIFIRTIVQGIDLPGYASLLCLILFFGGLQLMGIGIIGEYLGRTYMETKQRPIYIVDEIKKYNR